MEDNHYVDNKKFLTALKQYKDIVDEAENSGDEKPEVPEYIAECIIKIAEALSYKQNFLNYTFKEDMISDGIENCLTYVSNFDPIKYSNPFAYFTQIAYYAFVRRITREKKQYYIKYKLIENSGVMDNLVGYQEQDENEYMLNSYKEYLRSHATYNDYYEKEQIKKQRRKQQRKDKNASTKNIKKSK